MSESDVKREGENESRLLKARRSSSRSETGAAAQYGPGPIDVDSGIRNVPFAGRVAQRLHDRGIVNIPDAPSQFIDKEAAQSRRADVEQEAARDRANLAAFVGSMLGRNREQGMENQLNRQRRQEQKPEKERDGGGPSLREALTLAKAGPAGLASESLMNAGPGQGLSIEEIQRGIGRGCLMSLWSSVWPTFGHTIYLIGTLFFIAWGSRFARKYIPEVGEEWFPSQLLKKIPKATLIPIKLAEVVGIAFILFWTLMLDLACLGLIALILAIIMSAKNLVS